MKENLLLLKVYQNLKEHKLQIYDFGITNLHIDKSDDTVNEYNNTYHRTIKMKPIDLKPSTCIRK